MYSVNKYNGYIYSVVYGNNTTGNIITEEEYMTIKEIIHNIPVASDGFGYRLKESLEWELYELPEMPEVEEVATEQDYIDALERLGVCVNG